MEFMNEKIAIVVKFSLISQKISSNLFIKEEHFIFSKIIKKDDLLIILTNFFQRV